MNQVILVALIGITLAYFYFTSDTFQLKCVIAHKDGKTYCVRDTANIKQSAELLATAVGRLKQLVQYLKENHGSDERVERLVKNFNPDRIVETLPTSKHTAYSEDKGRKLAFCLRKVNGEKKLIDINTLMFVALHELGHLMTVSIGHEREFWLNFRYLIKTANKIGVYEPVDYSKSPQSYCGMQITDSPLYDLK